MKKLLVTYIAVAFLALGCFNIYKGFANEGLSDEEIMNEFIAENFSEQCCGTMYDEGYRDDFIHFVVYEGDTPLRGVSLNREYYQHLYGE